MPFKEAKLKAAKGGDRVSLRVGQSIIDGEFVKVWVGKDLVHIRLTANSDFHVLVSEVDEFKIYERSALEKYRAVPPGSRFRVREGVDTGPLRVGNDNPWRTKLTDERYHRPGNSGSGTKSVLNADIMQLPASYLEWQAPTVYEEV